MQVGPSYHPTPKEAQLQEQLKKSEERNKSLEARVVEVSKRAKNLEGQVKHLSEENDTLTEATWTVIDCQRKLNGIVAKCIETKKTLYDNTVIDPINETTVRINELESLLLKSKKPVHRSPSKAEFAVLPEVALTAVPTIKNEKILLNKAFEVLQELRNRLTEAVKDAKNGRVDPFDLEKFFLEQSSSYEKTRTYILQSKHTIDTFEKNPIRPEHLLPIAYHSLSLDTALMNRMEDSIEFVIEQSIADITVEVNGDITCQNERIERLKMIHDGCQELLVNMETIKLEIRWLQAFYKFQKNLLPTIQEDEIKISNLDSKRAKLYAYIASAKTEKPENKKYAQDELNEMRVVFQKIRKDIEAQCTPIQETMQQFAAFIEEFKDNKATAVIFGNLSFYSKKLETELKTQCNTTQEMILEMAIPEYDKITISSDGFKDTILGDPQAGKGTLHTELNYLASSAKVGGLKNRTRFNLGTRTDYMMSSVPIDFFSETKAETANAN